MSMPIVNHRRQSGAALAIALVLLVVVTLVGLASIRGTTLQEKMAGNQYDRGVAFQAAEAALALGAQEYRDDRSSWDDKIERPGPNNKLDCSKNTCAINPEKDGLDSEWVSLTGFQPLDPGNYPQYLVQRMGDCSISVGDGFVNVTDKNISGGGGGSSLQRQGTCYRITARAYDPTKPINAERAHVILQATWRL